MHIFLEEPGRLKITLTGAELRRFSLSFDQLDYENPATRGALMAEASAETGFVFQPGKLLIEAFPAPAGGCDLYFTVLDEAQEVPSSPSGRPESHLPAQRKLRLKRSNAAYTFEFVSADDMLAAMEQLYGCPDTAAAESDLYVLDSRYRLIFRPKTGERFSPLTLGEYASAFFHTAAAAAYTAEHGRLLAGNRAVGVVGRALCGPKAGQQTLYGGQARKEGYPARRAH